MLSKNDLIFLGAILLTSGEAAKSMVQKVNENDIETSIRISKDIYSKVFVSEEGGMILE